MLTPTTAAALGGLTLFLAFAPALLMAIAPPRTAATASLRLLCGVALTVLVMRVGAWTFASAHLANAAGVASFVGAIVGTARTARAGGGTRGAPWAWGLLALPLVGLVGWAFSAYSYSTPTMELAALPLGPGTYSVQQGGSSRLTNRFHDKADKLTEIAALDLVKLADSGNRAARFLPQALSDYASFGAQVLSPCTGEIVAAASDAPDTWPVPAESRAGNYVVLKCQVGLVKLGNLQRGSVATQPGAIVRAGKPIARIGCSGEGAEPHLHVGGFAHGTPLERVVAASGDVPVTFAGHVLVANTVFTIE